MLKFIKATNMLVLIYKNQEVILVDQDSSFILKVLL